MLEIPESLRAYNSDDAIKTAVDDLVPMLDGKKMPVDAWEEQKAFHKALLMAAKVRADFAEIMFEIHNKIWQGCGDLDREATARYSPQEIWSDADISRDFWLDENEEQWFSISTIVNKRELRAYCSHGQGDDEYAVPASVNIPRGWSTDKPHKDWIDAIFSDPIPLLDVPKILEGPKQPSPHRRSRNYGRYS